MAERQTRHRSLRIRREPAQQSTDLTIEVVSSLIAAHIDKATKPVLASLNSIEHRLERIETALHSMCNAAEIAEHTNGSVREQYEEFVNMMKDSLAGFSNTSVNRAPEMAEALRAILAHETRQRMDEGDDLVENASVEADNTFIGLDLD